MGDRLQIVYSLLERKATFQCEGGFAEENKNPPHQKNKNKPTPQKPPPNTPTQKKKKKKTKKQPPTQKTPQKKTSYKKVKMVLRGERYDTFSILLRPAEVTCRLPKGGGGKGKGPWDVISRGKGERGQRLAALTGLVPYFTRKREEVRISWLTGAVAVNRHV